MPVLDIKETICSSQNRGAKMIFSATLSSFLLLLRRCLYCHCSVVRHYLAPQQPPLEPQDPKEVEAKLAMLRRGYVKQVKEVRNLYIHEMELLQIEKQHKDEACREAFRVANEERKKLKAEAAQIRAQEHKIAQQEFRETLEYGSYGEVPNSCASALMEEARD
ncbi:uncharacterized protein LOC130980375 [Arachis stenosperma]|uniref:uncharacterized protein LOC130980375 n=1 Tax=Arachis stenosperma TaxID=217475 RepID=UPI0025ABD8F9|nr:uncharacterized protein LOC130980375 [Arachis stenosperma]